MKRTKFATRRKKQPLVSVIMPVYNAGRFLVPAIESILKQTYKNFELIIVDDASTDNSWEIIRKYKGRFRKRIIAIQMARNLNKGGDVCANEGLKYARGKYLARMDSDDISHPQRLEKQVAFLEKHRNHFLVGSNAYVIDEKKRIVGEKNEPLKSHDIYNAYFTTNPLIHPSCLYRRIFKNRKFSYEIQYSANNDYLTFFKYICKNYQFANLEEKLLYYRIHGGNDTFSHIRTKFMNTLRIRLRMMSKFGYNPSAQQLFITALQLFSVMLLPERFSIRLYLISKGIVKVENPLSYLSFLLRPQLSLRVN